MLILPVPDQKPNLPMKAGSVCQAHSLLIRAAAFFFQISTAKTKVKTGLRVLLGEDIPCNYP